MNKLSTNLEAQFEIFQKPRYALRGQVRHTLSVCMCTAKTLDRMTSSAPSFWFPTYFPEAFPWNWPAGLLSF